MIDTSMMRGVGARREHGREILVVRSGSTGECHAVRTDKPPQFSQCDDINLTGD